MLCLWRFENGDTCSTEIIITLITFTARNQYKFERRSIIDSYSSNVICFTFWFFSSHFQNTTCVTILIRLALQKNSRLLMNSFFLLHLQKNQWFWNPSLFNCLFYLVEFYLSFKDDGEIVEVTSEPFVRPTLYGDQQEPLVEGNDQDDGKTGILIVIRWKIQNDYIHLIFNHFCKPSHPLHYNVSFTLAGCK